MPREPGPYKFTHVAAFPDSSNAKIDRVVKCNGHGVGRVHPRFSNSSGVWEWFCWLSPGRNGTALDLAGALEAVKKDVLRREADGMIDFNYPPRPGAKRVPMKW